MQDIGDEACILLIACALFHAVGQTGRRVSESSNTLRPGEYARVRTAIAVRTAAMLVPQRAVNDIQCTYTVAAVVDPGSRIQFVPVKPGDRVGSNWIINEGLNPASAL